MLHVTLATAPGRALGSMFLDLNTGTGANEIVMPPPGSAVAIDVEGPEKFDLKIGFHLDTERVGLTISKLRDRDLLCIFATQTENDKMLHHITYAGSVVHAEEGGDCDVKCDSGEVTLEECCVVCKGQSITTKVCC